MIPGIGALGQPAMGSIYDETGTPVAHYEELGPYSCKNCVHKISMDSPYCIHPKVLGDPEMQSRLVLIDGRPTAKINMDYGCCAYVRQNARPDNDHDGDDEHGEDHE
jgi:hypothetical protein